MSEHEQPEFRFETAHFEVEHNGKKLNFVLPPFAEATYSQSRRILEGQGLRPPTFAEIVSLIQEFSKIETAEKRMSVSLDGLRNAYEGDFWGGKMRGVGIWGFTGLLYMPEGNGDYENGIIIRDKPSMRDGRVHMDIAELIEKLESNDENTRFFPYNSNGSKSFRDDLFSLALIGEEGTTKLEKIAKQCGNSPDFMLPKGILCGEKPKKPTIGLLSLRKDTVEYNYNNPYYESYVKVDCSNGDSPEYLRQAVGIIET